MGSIPYVDPQIDPLSTAVLSRAVTELGLCVDDRTDRWFPPEPPAGDERARASYEEAAERVCDGCPARMECLVLALRTESQPYASAHGIFGGLAPWDRKRVIRSRRRRALQVDRSLLADEAEGVSA